MDIIKIYHNKERERERERERETLFGLRKIFLKIALDPRLVVIVLFEL